MITQGTIQGVDISIASTNVGTKWWVDKYFTGVWEPETFDIFKRWIRPDSHVLDVGAFEGHTVMFNAQLAANVVCVECDPVALEHLKANIAINNLDNVDLVEAALSDQRGTAMLGGQHTEPWDFGGSGSRLDKGGSHPVETVVFDDLLRRGGVEAFDFIKMDIEGGEEYVIPAMESHLRCHRPTLYLSIHRNLMRGRDYNSGVSSGAAEELRSMLESIYPVIEDQDTGRGDSWVCHV